MSKRLKHFFWMYILCSHKKSFANKSHFLWPEQKKKCFVRSHFGTPGICLFYIGHKRCHFFAFFFCVYLLGSVSAVVRNHNCSKLVQHTDAKSSSTSKVHWINKNRRTMTWHDLIIYESPFLRNNTLNKENINGANSRLINIFILDVGSNQSTPWQHHEENVWSLDNEELQRRKRCLFLLG